MNTEDYLSEQDGLDELLGKNNVFYLPYLMGERSPHNDTNASAAFIGMRPDTTRKQLTLAVMEGVAFALRDCIEVAKSGGISIESTKICGGGAKSAVWKKIMANVFGVPVNVPTLEEGPAYGAAILAMVGAGEVASVEKAAERFVKVKERITPTPELAKAYDEKYSQFKELYPALKVFYAIAK